MKIQKQKIKVNIYCVDGSLVKGFIYLIEGLRLSDFLNTTSENFIPVSEAMVQNIGEIHSFKLVGEITRKKNIILLNKNSIKWIEEVQE